MICKHDIFSPYGHHIHSVHNQLIHISLMILLRLKEESLYISADILNRKQDMYM